MEGGRKVSDMIKQGVVILGCTGMLGSMMLDFFVRSHEFDIIAICRNHKDGKLLKNKYPKVDFRKLDVEKASLKGMMDVTRDADWLINAIGITKPYIHDDNPEEVQKAILVNSFFPHLLASVAKNTDSKVIQIATDCVYSGQKGQYVETDHHDALDVYGKTKSLGEVFGDRIYHLRCSIIGPQLKEHNSLMDWLLCQPKGAEVSGFTNHKWNGITTLHFAKICLGIIKKGADLPYIQHIVPADSINKSGLLKTIAREFRCNDIVINEIEAPTAVDRTLLTENAKLNKKLWQFAGYDTLPSIQRMVRELSEYQFYGKASKK